MLVAVHCEEIVSMPTEDDMI